MTILNTLKTAMHGLAANKLRAVLTALGVMIGVASVIATLALGNGARAAVEQNFRFLGSDEIQISPEFKFDEDEGGAALAGKALTYEDGLHLREAVPAVKRVEMLGERRRLPAARSQENLLEAEVSEDCHFRADQQAGIRDARLPAWAFLENCREVALRRAGLAAARILNRVAG